MTHRSKQGESSTQNPPIQVVGFRVEGSTVSPNPSPALKSVLSESADKDHSSVTPVIIPPAFHLREDSEEHLSRSTSDPLVDKAPVLRTLTAPAGTYSDHVKGDAQLEALMEGKQEGVAEEETTTSTMTNGNQSTVTDPNTKIVKVENNNSNPPQHDKQQQPIKAIQIVTTKRPENQGQEVPQPGTQPSVSEVESEVKGGGDIKGGGGGEVKSGSGTLQTPPPKKPTSTRAERRALQEKQKAEKSARKEAEGKAQPQKTQKSEKQSQKTQESEKQQVAPSENISKKTKSDAQPASAGLHMSTRVTEWFAHLPQYKELHIEEILESREAQHAHPLIIQLGKKYMDGGIKGGSERCIEMLKIFIKVIQDYKTPQGKNLSRDVSQYLNAQIAFLVRCKPLSAAMGNAIRSLKHAIIQIDPNEDENQAKNLIIEQINSYIEEKITFADNDIIMVYSYSTIVLSALLSGQKEGKWFQVIVVDSRPKLEGRKLLKQLIKAGIRCQYTHLNAIFYCMKEVSKVFLGATAVCSNGTIINSVGTAAVAACAHHLSKPVLVLCETCKFTERVQLDSFTNNEMGDPNELVELDVSNPSDKSVDLLNWNKIQNLGLVNQKLDLTKAEHVSLIVTELGMLPPTSVPAVIREYRQDQQSIVWG